LSNYIDQVLSPRERTVLDCIPAGHENAISRKRLAQVVFLDDRLIREIIYRLVVERGLPIGSSTGPEGGGYFLIQDLEDLEVATRHLKAQGTGYLPPGAGAGEDSAGQVQPPGKAGAGGNEYKIRELPSSPGPAAAGKR
jgi:hypothetical protein